MNVHCACLEWDFLWSVTKREKEQYRLPHNVVHKPADWPWKRQANLREEVQSMFLETGRQAGGGHVWVQVCIFMYTYMQVCTVLPVYVYKLVFHAYWSACLCACLCVRMCAKRLCASLIWGKTMFYIPQGNRVITEAGTQAWRPRLCM